MYDTAGIDIDTPTFIDDFEYAFWQYNLPYRKDYKLIPCNGGIVLLSRRCSFLPFMLMLPCRLFSAVFFPQDTVNIPADLLHFLDLIFERVMPLIIPHIPAIKVKTFLFSFSAPFQIKFESMIELVFYINHHSIILIAVFYQCNHGRKTNQPEFVNY